MTNIKTVVRPEDEGEAAQARYAACKPLAPVVRLPAPAQSSDGEDAAAAAPEEQPEPPSRVFYGNEQFYVFFRLHQYLYDRRAPEPACSVHVALLLHLVYGDLCCLLTPAACCSLQSVAQGDRHGGHATREALEYSIQNTLAFRRTTSALSTLRLLQCFETVAMMWPGCGWHTRAATRSRATCMAAAAHMPRARASRPRSTAPPTQSARHCCVLSFPASCPPSLADCQIAKGLLEDFETLLRSAVCLATHSWAQPIPAPER